MHRQIQTKLLLIMKTYKQRNPKKMPIALLTLSEQMTKDTSFRSNFYTQFVIIHYCYHFFLPTCNSNRGFVCPVCPSIDLSVHQSVMIESKSVKTRIYDAAVMIVCVCEWAWGGEGMPLPTRPQVTCSLHTCPAVIHRYKPNQYYIEKLLFKISC